MLVIPIEQKLDSNNPPAATLLLIIVNFFIFFAYQQPNDTELLTNAIDYYLQGNLYKYEKDVYAEYLLLNNPDKYDEYEKLEDSNKPYWVIQDIEFSHFLNTEYFTNNVTSLQWMDARAEFDRIVSKLSYLRFGLTPSNLSLVDLFTSMFLHGDTGHLIGNMIFLFIYGFSLEIALGRLWYLGIYLLSGIGGGLLTWAVSPDSLIPTIGASGAVFGLLGMYLGLYGLKKIKFFFTVGFYAHHFMAPALVLLPYWALIELYDQLSGQDHIAHFAHLGGLIAGAAIVALGKDRFIKVNRDYVEKIDEESPFKEKYERFIRQLDTLNIPQAKRLLTELLLIQPESMPLLKHQFDLFKLTPAEPEFESAAEAILKQPKTQISDAPMIARMANEYDRLSTNRRVFDIATRINLFNIFLRAEQQQDAEDQLRMLRDEPEAQNKMPGMLLRLANYLNARNQKTQANRYIDQILENFPDSDAANQVRLLKNA